MKKTIFLFVLLTGFQPSCQSKEEPTAAPPKPSHFSIGIVGSAEDVTTTTAPGIVLMGGGNDVDEAIRWMIDRSGGGDFVVIRASGSTAYNAYIYALGNVNSVETLLLDSREKASSPEVGKRLREAEALFIAGGDQSRYVDYWANTEVSRAINYLLNEKKVPVGGTSAGCAILSGYIFDAMRGSVVSSEALSNPYNPLVSLSKSFVSVPFLANTIADQHYSQRNREGRHFAFLARLKKDFGVARPKGIAVDEQTAVCIDADGNASVFGQGQAFFLQGGDGEPEVCQAGQPLTWDRSRSAVGVKAFTGSPAGTPAFNVTDWPVADKQFWYAVQGNFNIRFE